jgi:hypothetical protein
MTTVINWRFFCVPTIYYDQLMKLCIRPHISCDLLMYSLRSTGFNTRLKNISCDRNQLPLKNHLRTTGEKSHVLVNGTALLIVRGQTFERIECIIACILISNLSPYVLIGKTQQNVGKKLLPFEKVAFSR